MKQGRVYVHNRFAGIIEQRDGEFIFQYDADYLQEGDAVAVSLTLPLQSDAYVNKTLFAFFDGLIPEGWLLDLATQNWKINERDRMGLLLAVCEDCIGAVHVEDAARPKGKKL